MLHSVETLLPYIIQHLREKPDTCSRSKRNDSWMTAPQIARWIEDSYGDPYNPAQLDHDLLAWWNVDPASRPIRPATYPEENTLARLWGHVERVKKLSEPKRAERIDLPLELEMVYSLPADAPTVFISYANPDLHFAARVRLYLLTLGINSWMYARSIAKGERIFEAVQAAIDRADCMVALATPQSLASAWMFTETGYAVARGVKTVLAFDGNDPLLMALLESWHPTRRYGEDNFDQETLRRLKNVYAKFNSHSRVAKYKSSAGNLLCAMSNFNKCVYPRRTTTAELDPSIGDFKHLIVKIRNGEPL